METQEVSPAKTAMRWALVLGLAGIATNILRFVVGGYDPKTMNSGMASLPSWLMFAVIILVLILAMQQYRDKELGGYMSYGKGLSLGVLIGVFYGVISVIITFVIMTFILPADFTDKAMEVIKDSMMEKNPEMTEEQAEMGLKFAKFFMTPMGSIISAFLGSIILNFFCSLVIAAFVKKNNPMEVI